MPTDKPNPVLANQLLLTWMNKFNDLLDYSSLWDGGQLTKLTEDTGFTFSLASGGDLNTLRTTTKTYVPANALNSPVAVGGLVNVDAVNATTVTQVFVTLSTGVPRKFTRNLIAGAWTKWSEQVSVELLANLPQPSKKVIENACIYYGYPIGFNGLYSQSKVSSAFAKYDVLVLGDTYQKPTQEVYADTVEIIKQTKVKNSAIQIFGYVPIGAEPSIADSNLPMSELKLRVDQWSNIGATGIFLDEYGFDYKVTRDRQNEIVSYVHDKGMNVIANSWQVDYVFSSNPMYLSWISFEGNANSTPPVINDRDYVLFENAWYYERSGAQAASFKDQYESETRMYQAYYYYESVQTNGKTYADIYKTKTLALDAIKGNISLATAEKMAQNGKLASIIMRMDAYCASYDSWGANGVYREYNLNNFEELNEKSKSSIVASKSGASYFNIFTRNINGTDYRLEWTQAATNPHVYTTGTRKISVGSAQVEIKTIIGSDISRHLKIEEKLNLSEKGQAGGVAPLNPSGKLDPSLIAQDDLNKLVTATDILKWNNSQIAKLTTDAGLSKQNATDLNTILSAGIFYAITTTLNKPVGSGDFLLVEQYYADGTETVIQRAKDITKNETYYRTRTSSGWKPWSKVVSNTVLGNLLLGNKLVDQSNANFVGKVSGSTAANPHVAKVAVSSTLQQPTGFSVEAAQGGYSNLLAVDNGYLTYPTSTNTQYAQQLFSFNLIEHVQRTYGTIPGVTTADKVTWLKSNLSKLTFNWFGFGSSASGNKASIKMWNASNSSWDGNNFHTLGTVSKASISESATYMSLRIDTNGFAHFLAYAEASDGATSSVINTDYVELQVELSTDIKSNMPLATTTTPGDMSASDKLALDNAQKWKLTSNDGTVKQISVANINTITTSGEVFTTSDCIGAPDNEYYKVTTQSVDGFTRTQLATRLLSNELYIRATVLGEWSPWKKLTSTNLIGSILLGNKLVDTNIANFAGKVTGSVGVNPHVIKGTPNNHATIFSTTPESPSSGKIYEVAQADYNKSYSLDSAVLAQTTNINTAISQQVFSFNLVEHIQRAYGTIPGSSISDKVSWIRSNVSKLTMNWYGLGSGATGNKATIVAYSTSWNGAPASHTLGSVSKLSSIIPQASVPIFVQSDGFAHFTAYAEPSNGTIASSLSTDYAELQVELSTDLGSSAKPQWVTATLQNSWVEFDATQTPKFNLGKDGFVDLVGAIKLGVLGQTAFTLPVGYRPTKMIVAMGIGAPGNHYRIIVATSGAVTIDQSVGTNGNAAVYLDNIRFPTT